MEQVSYSKTQRVRDSDSFAEELSRLDACEDVRGEDAEEKGCQSGSL